MFCKHMCTYFIKEIKGWIDLSMAPLRQRKYDMFGISLSDVW